MTVHNQLWQEAVRRKLATTGPTATIGRLSANLEQEMILSPRIVAALRVGASEEASLMKFLLATIPSSAHSGQAVHRRLEQDGSSVQ
jgi:hypothetical protein